MEKTTKSATISQLIDMLNKAKDDFGDVEVVLSSDPEGNSFGTIDTDVTENASVNMDEKMLVIYPFVEFTDF